MHIYEAMGLERERREMEGEKKRSETLLHQSLRSQISSRGYSRPMDILLSSASEAGV